MAQVAETTCLYTTVKNLTSATRSFGYLGVHGMRLAPLEAVTTRGDLIAKWGATTSNRCFKSLEFDLTNKIISILSTPSVFLYDQVLDIPRTLALSNDVLGIVDPCWESSGSSLFRGA